MGIFIIKHKIFCGRSRRHDTIANKWFPFRRFLTQNFELDSPLWKTEDVPVRRAVWMLRFHMTRFSGHSNIIQLCSNASTANHVFPRFPKCSLSVLCLQLYIRRTNHFGFWTLLGFSFIFPTKQINFLWFVTVFTFVAKLRYGRVFWYLYFDIEPTTNADLKRRIEEINCVVIFLIRLHELQLKLR